MKNLLNKLLIYYEDKDFALRLKARFVLVFTFIIIIAVLTAAIFSTILANSFDVVILPLSILLLIILFSLRTLIKGQYLISIYIIMSSAFMTTWFILFFEPVSAINQTNSIVYVVALLSAMPFLLSENKYPLFVFFGLNILLLLGYAYYLGTYNILNKVDLVDYLLDNTVAFIFVFAVSYNLFSIYRSLLLKIEQDLQENKQLAKKLNSAQLLLNNIISGMPSILIAIDSNFRITRWNKESEIHTGINSYQAGDSDLFTVFPNLLFLKKKLENVLSNGVLMRNERIEVNWGEKYKYVDIVVYPLILNEVEGAVIRIDDISESVKLEDHVIQSDKMKTLGTLATGMAHEINNPLAGMIQNTQLALNRLKFSGTINNTYTDESSISLNDIEKFISNRKITEILKRVSLEGNRIASIIEEMLSFSNPTSSQYLYNKFEEIVEKSVDLAHKDYELKTKYNFSNIEIIREYESDLPKIQCSQAKIMQVILNLLKNSSIAISCRDYKKNEQPQIILRAIKNNQFIRFEVEDNGIGISKTALKRIFEPFFTTMPVGEGSGLGLYITYFIVTRNHGGTIHAESKKGSGTKFIVNLPIINENHYEREN